ncbi:hypothetical protein MMC32_000534 [Xylographa parallela]|nr:hypothetical protein [Xylographa parallela]
MEPVQVVLDSNGRTVNVANGHRYGPQPAWKQRAPALYMSQMPPRPYLQQPSFQIGQDLQPSHKDHGNSILDDYDHALLAEPHHDRQWQAAHGINRLSLPVRPTMATSYDDTLHDPFTENGLYYGHTSGLDFCKAVPSSDGLEGSYNTASPFLQNLPPSTRNASGRSWKLVPLGII